MWAMPCAANQAAARVQNAAAVCLVSSGGGRRFWLAVRATGHAHFLSRRNLSRPHDQGEHGVVGNLRAALTDGVIALRLPRIADAEDHLAGADAELMRWFRPGDAR